MEKVIASIIIIVLTLGLISYAIIGQIGGFKDTSDQVSADQARLSLMLNDSSIVSKNTVKYYIQNADLLNINVMMDGAEATLDSLNNVSESALYKMSKTYKDDGSVDTVTFTIESQSN